MSDAVLGGGQPLPYNEQAAVKSLNSLGLDSDKGLGDHLSDTYYPKVYLNDKVTPVGTIIAYMGKTAPAGYLFCNGSVYNIASYPDLSAHIKTQFGSYNYFGGDGSSTFAVPNLQGEFLRCTGTNGHEKQGSGGEVGEHQDATVLSKPWDYNSGTSIVTEAIASNTLGAYNYDSSISMSSRYKNHGSPTGTRTHPFPTARPTNTSVLYCIKY